MCKNVSYLLLLILLMASTGCQTVKGAACGAASGFSQDVKNLSNPDKNGWSAIQKADAWERQNMW